VIAKPTVIVTETQSKTGLVDAVQTGFGQLDNLAVALGVMDFRFMGGSMGSVVGEKLTRLVERATQSGIHYRRVPLAVLGCRRMLSLMQMAKISAAER